LVFVLDPLIRFERIESIQTHELILLTHPIVIHLRDLQTLVRFLLRDARTLRGLLLILFSTEACE
jgi:hypothetical protein